MRASLAALAVLSLAGPAAAQVPAGMTPLITPDLKGWHWSRTNHHGTEGRAVVEDGVLYLSQNPYGQGGLFLTDKRYRNFELQFEVDVPWGANSGVFLRSSEGGSAYQIELTQFAGGPPTGALQTGALFGEGLTLTTPSPPFGLEGRWKPGWNLFRIRMTGDAPKITVWLNGEFLWEAEQTKNMKIGGETDGRIGLQLHWTATFEPQVAKASEGRNWKPGQRIAWRNIAIKELP